MELISFSAANTIFTTATLRSPKQHTCCTREKVVATGSRGEGACNRAGNPSVPFRGRGGMTKRYEKSHRLFEWSEVHSDVVRITGLDRLRRLRVSVPPSCLSAENVPPAHFLVAETFSGSSPLVQMTRNHSSNEPNLNQLLVRITGLEPAREAHWNLNPARLPIPPYPHEIRDFHPDDKSIPYFVFLCKRNSAKCIINAVRRFPAWIVPPAKYPAGRCGNSSRPASKRQTARAAEHQPKARWKRPA